MHLCYYVYYDYDVTTPDFFVFFLLFSLQQVPSQNAFRGQQVTFTFEYFVRNKVYIDN